mgnify:CR=1 FL=1
MLPITPKVMGQVFYDTLPGIKVSAGRIQKSSDIKSTLNTGQYSDSFATRTLKQYRHLSIATLLSQQSPVFIKSYGINSMATLSFRGASAAQSMVLWKGIPLNNPALGVSDISLIQTGLFSKIGLQYGGNAALLGSGNIGGALILDDQPQDPDQSTYNFSLGAGSFGRKDISAQGGWNYKKWQFGIKGFAQSMRNNFKYLDINGATQRTQNAELLAAGAIGTINYSFSERQNLSLDVWYQNYYREIPKAQFEDFSTKIQEDKALRSLLQWNNQSRIGHWFAKLSFNTDYLNYQDSFYNIHNNNITRQYYQEIGWKHSLSFHQTKAQHTFFVNAPFQYAWIDLQDGRTPYQSKPAISAAYQYLHGNKRLGLQANVRQEWLNGDPIPLLPGGGLQYLLFNREQLRFTLKGSVQRTYRVPTLNELYNFPGGNENLKPEQGWNRELAYDLSWNNKAGTLRLSHQLNYFNRKIQDWIYWLGGSIWTPHNLAKVHNRGVETNNALNYDCNKDLVLHIGIKTAYVLSTTLESYMPNDGSIGKQIPYAPRYSGNINAGLTYKGILVNYDHTYTGYRFVTTDESIFLQPYNTGNLQVMFPLPFKKADTQLGVQVQNIWNTQYEVIAYRPMPLRFFLINLSVAL